MLSKEQFQEIIKRHCSGKLPSYPEDIYQSDIYAVGSLEILEDVCEFFSMFEDED